jgi:hypothetical protein
LNLFIFFFFCCCIQTIEKMSPVIFTLSPDPLIKRASFLSFDVLLDFFFVRFFSTILSQISAYSILCYSGWLFFPFIQNEQKRRDPWLPLSVL